MKKKIILGLLLVGTITLFSGCNTVTKNFGGTQYVDLPKGQKLVNATWKDDDFWYLTKPMTDNDKAETYDFKEISNFGVCQGDVIIKETK
jgi:uncharacterized protein YceK